MCARLGFVGPVCVIPNGVDLATIKPARVQAHSCPHRNELLFLGRLHSKKGVLELLRGWELFCAKSSKSGDVWHLNIVGWGEQAYCKQLELTVAELGVSDSVYFAGPKFGDELWAAYAQADAFILPSHDEGMPMAVLEAWASGLPVIMTPQCGLSEGFASGAAIETSTHPEDIAEAIATIARMSSAARRKMGRAGLDIVKERYSWTNIAATFRLVYMWIAGCGPIPDCVVGARW